MIWGELEPVHASPFHHFLFILEIIFGCDLRGQNVQKPGECMQWFPLNRLCCIETLIYIYKKAVCVCLCECVRILSAARASRRHTPRISGTWATVRAKVNMRT